MRAVGGTSPFRLFHSLLLLLALFSVEALSQARCSKESICKTGCCSKDGFCGTTDAYCGDGCQSTCDFQAACDAKNPCPDGSCCSKAGFCGFGPDYCASDNCVGNCDAKSECDPSFGQQWANATACPLNACCSDTGYCGITQEFCGDRKFSKPTCKKDYPVSRVVGYYEGGAVRRSCNQFSPDDIPANIYTHINFAYAVIDPVTFRVTPAFKDDIQTYHDLAKVKRRNPGLKAFISVGGWQFGEGPTEKVFSQMVASEENQRAFITSIVSFINTYDFDGVDIDWRYPTAPQKGGSSDDTKNYVVFAENLQAALRTNGLRDGFSVTVPAVYSYLQYFDLKQLSDHVNWFNVLAFDLHGAFRSPDSWVNNKLNAHTNLTEIADTVDLIWRSGVPSAKVVMGLAFYSRTFTASSTKCVSKGCSFDSAGRGERCSDEIGLLSNAEIHRMLSWSGTKPRLDKEAAVQVVRYDDQWITYEDKTTLQIKLDFARSQCMGGVAVWSVSQDTNSGTYSRALQSAISTVSQVQTPTKPSNQTNLRKRDEGDLNLENVPLDSCRWTNCGGACPSGWTAILRDEEGKEFQTIWEDSGCTTPEVRTWCCPPGEEPRCEWSAWNRGMCMSSCRDGYVEVGSSKIACDSGSQLAYCSTKTKDGLIIDSMRIWDKCRWEGEEPVCGPTNGPDEPCSEMEDDRRVRLAKAFMGSGSTKCLAGSKGIFHFEVEQNLCCKPKQEEDQNRYWDQCFWNADALDDGHCRAGCPQASSPTGYTKLALSSNGGCESGSAAYCCKPTVTRKYDKDSLESYLESKVAEWVESPTCPADVNKRSIEPDSTKASIKAARREFDPEPSPHEVLEEVVYGFITLDDNNHEYEHVLDAQLTERWTHVTSDNIDIVYRYSATVRDMVEKNREPGIASLLCRLNEWDDFMGSGGTNKTLTCSLSDLPDELYDEYEAPEIEIPIHDGLKVRDHDLAPRAKGEGRARPIVVTVKGNANNKKNKIYWVIWSQPYYNGDKLAEKNKDKKYYMLEFDPDDCTKAEIVYTDQKNGQNTEGEHLPELQTMGDFWGFLSEGRIPAINESIENPLIGEEFINELNPAGYGRYWVETYLQTSFARWQAEYGNISPMDHIFHAIGSQDDASHMVNTHSVVNNMKAIIWGRKQFIGDKRLGRYTRDTSIATTRSIGAIYNVAIGVFQYLNHANIVEHMRQQNLLIVRILEDAERLIRQQMEDDDIEPPANMNLVGQWRFFMNGLYERIAARAQQTAQDRIQRIRQRWEERLYDNFFAPWRTNGGNVDEPVEEQYRITNFLFFLDSISRRATELMTLPNNFWSDDTHPDSGDSDSDSGNDDPVKDPDWDPDKDDIPRQ